MGAKAFMFVIMGFGLSMGLVSWWVGNDMERIKAAREARIEECRTILASIPQAPPEPVMSAPAGQTPPPSTAPTTSQLPADCPSREDLLGTTDADQQATTAAQPDVIDPNTAAPTDVPTYAADGTLISPGTDSTTYPSGESSGYRLDESGAYVTDGAPAEIIDPTTGDF